MIFDPSKLEDWHSEDLHHWLRIYWKPNAGGNGFDFVSFDVTGMTSSPDDPNCESDPFLKPDTEVEIMLHGIAMFDGVRHLYFGSNDSDNYGYFNYPKWDRIEAVIKKIKELERELCSDPSNAAA